MNTQETQEQKKLQQIEKTKEVLNMIKNSQTPPELVEKIAKMFKIEVKDATPVPTDEEHVYKIQDAFYLITDDNTADKLWEDDMNDHFAAHVLPEIDESYHWLIDKEKWKSEYRPHGRELFLAEYDQEEHELAHDGALLYFYRVY